MAESPYLSSQADGLLARESGPWVAEKLTYLKRYIEVFETSMKDKWADRSYIDLFSGPGKCIDRKSSQTHLGSPLIALTTKYPFTAYYFVDAVEANVNALKKRCSASPLYDRVNARVGDANTEVVALVEEVRRTPSLNLAFLDPEGLELHWQTVAELALVDKMDLIIHYPQMGLSRWMPRVIDAEGTNDVDRFFGGTQWRTVFEAHRRGEEAFLHRELMDHYKANLAQLGYQEALRDDEVGIEPLMVNEKAAPLYRLLFASKHPLGIKFWRKITDKDSHGQRRLFS